MTWALAGQVAVYWIAAGVFVAVAYSRARSIYRANEARKHFRRVLADHKKVMLPRAELISAVASDLKDSGYLERARKAEALGFLSEDDVA